MPVLAIPMDMSVRIRVVVEMSMTIVMVVTQTDMRMVVAVLRAVRKRVYRILPAHVIAMAGISTANRIELCQNLLDVRPKPFEHRLDDVVA